MQAGGLFREALAQKSRHLLAVYCYQQRLLSLGKAARLAEMNRWDFIDLLAEQNVPILEYSNDELTAEFSAVEKLRRILKCAELRWATFIVVTVSDQIWVGAWRYGI